MSSFEKHIAKSIITKKKLIKLEKKINIVIKKMHECLSSNNKIFICGNGGSAADAQHVSTEFLVRLKPNLNRKSFPIICLGNDMTYLTACSNDLGFDKVFSRNLSALHKNDEKNILICLSTSGNSKNILEVLNLAKKAHNALKCRGITRSDFKFENNKFYLLEINTQPGMTDLSLVPEIAKYVNISFQKLVKNIIDDASNNR